ncbi:MAG: hypothetical protein ACK4QW_13425 [Alphaproteobacteria bacterium]
MWFWIGLLMVLAWGGWGYVRRRWWLREIARSMERNAAKAGPATLARFEEPHWIALPDRVVTAAAGALAVIGVFLMLADRWRWLAG